MTQSQPSFNEIKIPPRILFGVSRLEKKILDAGDLNELTRRADAFIRKV